MDYYQLSFVCLVTLNTALASRQYRQSKSASESGLDDKKINYEAVNRFQKSFYLVYCVAVAADWLRGPHIYALYRYENGLSEKAVAALYASGFVSEAISASYVGSLANKHVRRAACLVYCLTYSMCCMTMISDSFTVLILGRILGGIDYHGRDLELAGLDLGNVFGRMITLSSIVSILCCVVDDMFVQALGLQNTPFLASVCCLYIAAMMISICWKEKHGENAESRVLAAPETDTRSILWNPQVLALAMTPESTKTQRRYVKRIVSQKRQ